MRCTMLPPIFPSPTKPICILRTLTDQAWPGRAGRGERQRMGTYARTVSELDAALKPRLRGVSHQWAFFVAVAAGAALVVSAEDGRSRLALGIYALTVCGLFGVSAVYHRVNWRTPEARRRIRRADHSMIFVFIAGSYTPFAMLVLEGSWATAIARERMGGRPGRRRPQARVDRRAEVADRRHLHRARLGRRRRLAAAPAASACCAVLLIGLGGVLYTAGAIVYATRSPTRRPRPSATTRSSTRSSSPPPRSSSRSSPSTCCRRRPLGPRQSTQQVRVAVRSGGVGPR